MRVFVGIILGMLLLVGAVFISDSMQTSAVANGQTAQTNRTLVNWDVVADDWHALKTRAHDDWVRISSK
ncbi:hypothetical protein [Bradyrhizobium sp.]|jgi:hypothetical protein|uniref:hypothetical protein n=1 Tax=Bradyrhizobium sp. TaxID=376 RepID=UPI002C511770|nr:hypothetical protein [Bradyrhizobium sp.]HWX60375.1 hypothetical protein [Bradyrhizobium sp.]